MRSDRGLPDRASALLQFPRRPAKEHCMNGHAFTLAGTDLIALASGALYWPAQDVLCVSDLHLGKAARRGRLGQATLPPYETRDTLARLGAVLGHIAPRTVICLGDSFDDPEAARELSDPDTETLRALQNRRRWIWIEGNHDPGPLGPAGEHMPDLEIGALRFTHIATPQGSGEISGHYHPKATVRSKGRAMSRPAFLIDATRVILPAFGTYTGGLRCSDPVLARLMSPDAIAVLTGARALCLPMGRA